MLVCDCFLSILVAMAIVEGAHEQTSTKRFGLLVVHRLAPLSTRPERALLGVGTVIGRSTQI